MLRSGSDYHFHVQSLDSSLNTGQFIVLVFGPMREEPAKSAAFHDDLQPAVLGLEIASYSTHVPVFSNSRPDREDFSGRFLERLRPNRLIDRSHQPSGSHGPRVRS